MKPHIFRSVLITGLFLGGMIIPGCRSPKKQSPEPVPAFNAAIAAFTSGTLSAESTIRIRFNESFQGKTLPGEPVRETLFEFDPRIKGEAFWLDDQTIEFRPSDRLASGKEYTVTFNLSKILPVPDNQKTFRFTFRTIQQSFSLFFEGLSSSPGADLRWTSLEGKMITADVMNAETAKQLVSAKQGKRVLPVSLSPGPGPTTFHFLVDSVSRGEKPGNFTVSWSGKKHGMAPEGEEKFEVPALGDFKIMDVRVIHQPSQHIDIRFSDPLQARQNLKGLVRLQNNTDLTFTIENQQVKAYPAVRQSGQIRLYIEPGIKNALDYRLEDGGEFMLSFESIKPAVRFLGKGVILPDSKGLILPFEAVNLSAVDISIIKIYENNITQFLQVNQLEDKYQLKRAGRLILKKTLPLLTEQPVDYGRWNTFSLDLANLIKPDPGSVYRVEIGFRKEHSRYPCDNNRYAGAELPEEETPWDEVSEDEVSYWDMAEDYYEDYYYDDDYYYYDWRERDNPCSNAYYGARRTIGRNVLASDIGIIAKGGSNRKMIFAVTDLRTTTPLSGVDIEIYNYQKQLLGTTRTNSEGLAGIDPGSKPFLLIAKMDKQRAYLRLDDGSSLSMGKFDISGATIQKGLKGFIYGERGVWRPGDSLFVSFILEDSEKMLPQNHPVVAELINPMGQVVKKQVKSGGMDGFCHFVFTTDREAPTGFWTVKITVGGVIFTRNLRVETVKPNRLKILLDFTDELLSPGKSGIRGKLEVRWLHGAVAKNLRANVMVRLSSMKTVFSRYPDHIFDDPARKFESEEFSVFEGRVGPDGKAEISSPIDVREASPGMLRASFLTRVFEEGGDFSTDQQVKTYSPYSVYLGIRLPKGDKARGMLLTDTSHVAEIVSLSPEGKPVSRNNIDVKIYKLNWRWWWEASDENLATYIGSNYSQLVHSGKAETRNGEGAFSFRINYPDWGRYLVRITDPESGHSTGKIVYIDWPGWAGRGQRENPGGATLLTFSADKEKYLVGESAQITLPTPGQGRALVSIENGTRIIHAFWLEIREKETRFSVKLTREMCPNIYVNISLLQPHSQSVNDLPVRLYGAIPVFVEDPSTRLSPLIKMPDVIRPEENVRIEVSEISGKEMTYTLAVVEDGLLDLTRFKTPDPWNAFYAREALGVKTWDMFDQVIGAYGGKIEQIFGIGGGDEAETDQAAAKANRFKPVVICLGPFRLSRGKTNSHLVKIPNYIGSVRTMVVAGNSGAYGSAEKTSSVRKPLMVLATMPRVVGPGESLSLPVSVFVMENHIRNVQVEVKTNEKFSITGTGKKNLSFAETGDQLVKFALKAEPVLGVGRLKVIATSGDEKAGYEVEIDVRNPNPEITESSDAIVNPGKSWSKDFTPVGIRGTNKAYLEVSNIPPVDFGRRLKYLLTYPHGCIEQITSAAFPQLFLAGVMELDADSRTRAEQNIKAALERLHAFSRSDGSFGMWPGSTETNDWGTSYAGHFMLEAEKKGFNLPVGLKRSWLNYQKKAARNWSPPRDYQGYFNYAQYDLAQAYRLYTLALANEPELGAMNRLRESPTLGLQGKWRLAAAYALAGQEKLAGEMAGNLEASVQEYSGSSYTFGSATRDRAMILETLCLINDNERAIDLVKNLAGELSGTAWLSTQSTAYSLLALSKFMGSHSASGEMRFSYALNGARPVKASTRLALSRIELKTDDIKPGRVEVENLGEGILFVRLILEGVPEVDQRKASENGLQMEFAYLDPAGNPINISSLRQGTDFLARVTVRNPGSVNHLTDLALSQVFPSGWEIRNLRLEGNESAYRPDSYTYQDIRDDRVYTYFSLGRNQSKTFYVLLHASYAGRFYHPELYAEAMYDERIHSRKPGQWVEVTEPTNE